MNLTKLYAAYADTVCAKGCQPVTYAEWLYHAPEAQTPGKLAYQRDCERKPLHNNGERRKTWFELTDTGRTTWECRAARAA